MNPGTLDKIEELLRDEKVDTVKKILIGVTALSDQLTLIAKMLSLIDDRVARVESRRTKQS